MLHMLITDQMDFVFFIYGFLFLLMAVVLPGLKLQAQDRLAWAFLAWFGVLHGGNEWLDMLVVSLGDGSVFKCVRLAFMSASFIMLCEFGRRSVKAQGGRAPGVWVYGPLLALAGLGGGDGMNGLNAACRYALGLPGAVLAGWVIFRQSQSRAAGRRWPLVLAGLAFFIYGLATGLVVPAAAFSPASILNHDTFLAAAGFPIQLFRALCALAAALGFYIAYQQSRAPASHGYRRWMILFVLGLLLTGGFFLTNWRGGAADAAQRESMLSQATAIARMMSIEHVRALTFTPDDRANPHFQLLRSQLTAYSRAIGHRSIYTQALRSDRLVFGPESLAEDDPQASLPGRVYEQPTSENFEAFGTGRPFTEGPATDEYGTFISAFAPVLDPRTASVLLLVGMDVDAEKFQAAIAHARLMAILFLLSLVVIVLVGMDVLPLQQRLSGERKELLRHAQAFLLAFFGIIMTLGLAYLVNDFQTQSRRTIFSQLAAAQAGIITEAVLGISDYRLDSLGRFIEGTRHITQQDFTAYAADMVEDGTVQPLGWSEAVDAGMKSQAESQARLDGLTDFMVYQTDGQGKRIPASDRDTYYPVRCLEPPESTAMAAGYDLASGPGCRAAMEEALRTAAATASDPIALGPENRAQKGVFVLRPVFKQGSAPRLLRGFAFAVVRLWSLLNKNLALSSGLGQPPVVMGLYQVTAAGAPQLLAASPLTVQLNPVSIDGSIAGSDAALHAVFPLFAFGRAYALIVQPSPLFLAENPAWGGWLVVLVGLFVTAVLSVFIGFLNNRRAYLERQVGTRTAELQEQRQQLEDVIVGTHIGTWQWNIQTGGFVVNECWAEIIGYRVDELLPLSLQRAKDMVHPEDLPRLEQALDDTLQGLRPLYECEYRMRRRDGYWFWVQDMGRIMQRSAAGEPLRMSGTHADMNDRKESERVLKETLAELKRSNTELEHFAYVASHDLQEPLRMVVSYLQLLARRYKDRLDADADEFIGFAVDGAQRMQTLINDLLAYSRVGTKGKPFDSTDCNEAVQCALANLEVSISETGARIDCGKLPTVFADSSQVVQLFQNLVGNALKYRSPEPPRIGISAELREQEWIFSVEDNGIGIEPRYFERIFVIFQRLHSRSEHSGTGIGLAVCKKIVERHGGIIWVSSEPGTGSTFYFTIPAGEGV